MNKRRAYEEVTIAHGEYAFSLRPSLRAATILEDRFGIPALHKGLAEFNLTIISEIILVSVSSGSQNAAAFLSSVPGRPLLPFFLSVRAPLAELVSMLTPAPDQKAKPSKGKSMPWAGLFAALYDRATGWLGWAPEQAWNATPTEIDRAYRAHFEKLQALHGAGSDEEGRPDVDTDALTELLKSDGLDPDFDRSGLHKLKGQRRVK